MATDLIFLCILTGMSLVVAISRHMTQKARTERDALATHLTNVRRLHRNSGTLFTPGPCAACDEPWPCRTYTATGYVPVMKEPLP